MDGDTIEVEVSYGGGCAEHEHEFELCWNGDWLRTSPPQAPLSLGHNAHGDMCMAYFYETLRFNASEVIEDALTTDETDPVDFDFGLEGYTALYEF